MAKNGKSIDLGYKRNFPALKRQSSASSSQAPLPPLPYITAQSWMLFDGLTGKTIQSKKATIKREVASLTKMMTLYTTCQLLKATG